MLFRTILSLHFRFFIMITFIGLSLYLLVEIFEKIAVFAGSGAGFINILFYFLYKIPSIVSTLIPIIFFLATIISLCLMAKNKELVALQTGGISLIILLKYMICISLFWACIQLVLSQYIGISMLLKSNEIWSIEIRHRTPPKERVITNTWLTHDEWLLNIERLAERGVGQNIVVYKLNKNGDRVEEILSSSQLSIKDEVWTLANGIQNFPNTFEVKAFSSYTLPFERDYKNLFVAEATKDLQNLPIQELYEAIQELKYAGSNVEALETTFQAKIAYSASLIALTFVAFALLTWKESVYICTFLGVFIAFLFYVSIMITETLGKTGQISPYAAAWGQHIFVILASCWRLYSSQNSK